MHKEEFVSLLKEKIDSIFQERNSFISERDIYAATVIELEDEVACLKKKISNNLSSNKEDKISIDNDFYMCMLCYFVKNEIKKQPQKICTVVSGESI